MTRNNNNDRTDKNRHTDNLAIESPQEYSQLERLRQIHDSRRLCKRAAQQSKELAILGKLPDDKALELYHSAVKSHIMDLFSVISDENVQTGVWDNTPLGTITPNPNITRKNTGNIGKEQYVYQITPYESVVFNDYTITPREHKINGLGDIVNNDARWNFRIIATTHNPVSGEQRERYEFTEPVPRKILDQALMLCDQFRRSVRGLDLDPKDQLDEEVPTV